ncbi:MAG TPA: exodeoxyribonuclease VII small subunit [Verrucomicrobia bacterium]|nr:exodeoxyribonuclease VII small subunit [Verrucomicrobiota bacterium]
MSEKQAKADAPSFEKSMERLETIVSDMEGGTLSLESMIKQFEEGQSLIRFCTGKLDEVERKIERLLSKEGPVETEPFPDDTEDSADDAAPKPKATKGVPKEPKPDYGRQLFGD